MSAPPMVLEDWSATCADPIREGAGKAVRLDGGHDMWDGRHVRLLARAEDRRAGWLPDALPVADANGWRATRAFDACELTCRSGDCPARQDATQGWALCREQDRRRGWVPQRNLAIPTPPAQTARLAPFRATGARR